MREREFTQRETKVSSQEAVLEREMPHHAGSQERRAERGRTYRAKHREEIREYKRLYRAGHREEIREYKKVWGAENREYMVWQRKVYYAEHGERLRGQRRTYYAEHQEPLGRQKKRRRKLLKLECLFHYGNGRVTCVHCSESDIDTLCLDHIEGNGGEERRRCNTDSSGLYGRLAAAGYPEGYQTLCANCNMLKEVARRGHDTEERDKHRPEQHRHRCIRTRDNDRKKKSTVIAHYSRGTNECATCGDGRLDVLTIDHTNGGGKRHRRNIGIRGGGHFYRWLVRSGLPSGYQVLCSNCQQRKEMLVDLKRSYERRADGGRSAVDHDRGSPERESRGEAGGGGLRSTDTGGPVGEELP